MTNGLRHGLGALIGIVVTPLVWVGMFWSAVAMWHTAAMYVQAPTLTGTVIPLVVMLAVAAILGLLTAAPFVSPVAALITGSVNLLFGLAFPLVPHPMFEVMRWMPADTYMDASTPGLLGVYALVGVILLVSAAFPHHWRGAYRPAARPATAYPPPPQPPQNQPRNPPQPPSAPMVGGGGPA